MLAPGLMDRAGGEELGQSANALEGEGGGDIEERTLALVSKLYAEDALSSRERTILWHGLCF